MTLTGGEPTVQPRFVLALLKAAHEKKIHSCLDTCGHAKWEVYEELLDHVDLFLWDIKHMDTKRHESWAGVGNERILDNLKKVAKKAKVRIRVPVIPNVNDSEENMRETAEFAESLGENIEGVDLLPYHPYAGAKYRLFGLDYPFPMGEGYNEDRVLELMHIFAPHVEEVTIGG